MKSVAVGLFAIAGLACGAQADMVLSVPSNQQMLTSANASIVASPMHGSGNVDLGTPLYSSIPGPYFSTAVGTYANRDDYTSTAGGNFIMDVFRFVGGVAQVNGILDIFVLDSNVGSPTVISSFAIQLPSAGNFVWTITLAPGSNVVCNPAGQIQIQTRGTTTGQIFASSTAATPGSNSFASGYGSTFTTPSIMAFELQTPAPGSIALLGLGGIFAARRRRQA